MAALLRQRRVVNHQHAILASDKPVRLNQQFRFQWCCIPDASRYEMVQLVILPGSQARRHRLNTLPLTRPDQAGDVEGAHSSPCLVAQTRQERLKPARKLQLPIRHSLGHDRLSKSRSATNHQSADSGIPTATFSAKVVLGSFDNRVRFDLNKPISFDEAGYSDKGGGGSDVAEIFSMRTRRVFPIRDVGQHDARSRYI